MNELFSLPPDLPRPGDDGLCSHLEGNELPVISLYSTAGGALNLGGLSGRSVIYIHPMIGDPRYPLPHDWDTIPGARGCTPQSCSFGNLYEEFRNLRATILGLSSQSHAQQKEAAKRLRLPFALVSDPAHSLAKLIKIPLFQTENQKFYKRVTLICEDAKIVKVFYPVYPPDRNAGDVLAYLRNINAEQGGGGNG